MSVRDRGSATVTALVLMFAFTAGAVIWLASDVNTRVANRSAAQSVAFQAARSGAQQIAVDDLRSGTVVVDATAADREARRSAARLLASYGLTGNVRSVHVDGPTVTVELLVYSSAGDVTGVASAEARTGP